MEGMFLRKKFNIWLFLLFLCGLAFIGMYIFLNIVDPEATSELLTFLIIGIMLCLVVIPSWLLNLGAYIHIDETSIKAKYHWFGKIDCNISDVDFVLGQGNSLTIQLNNGKRHTIMGIENAFSLSSAIRQNMSFETTEQPNVLIQKLNDLKQAKKQGVINVCLCLALMFINIFVTVFLTGERDLHEFSKTDWIIFIIMGVLELIIVIGAFYLAQKTGKNNLPIEKLQFLICKSIIETKPPLPNYLIQVLTDDNYRERISIFGYPHRNTVYFIVEAFDADYNLIQVFTSETYENHSDLPADFETLIDITDKVLH